MIFKYKHKLKSICKPFMVKVKNYSTVINENAIDYFVATIGEEYYKKGFSRISFPVYVELLYNCYKNKIGYESLTETDLKHLITKISNFCLKYLIANLLYNLSGNSQQWYLNYSPFSTHEIKNTVNLGISFHELNIFMSWGIKRHHNKIFLIMHENISILEKKFNIKNNYTIDTAPFNLAEIQLLQEYLPHNILDNKNSKKSLYINSRYFVNTLITDKQLIHKLQIYDQKNDKHITKQLIRYLKEILIYLRILNLIKNILDNGYIQDINKKNMLNELIKSVKSTLIDYYIPYSNSLDISNKIVDRFVSLMNHMDNQYCYLILNYTCITSSEQKYI